MNRQNPYLIAMDFDGTMAATFEPSPQGMNVNIASERAIESAFGPKGLEVYRVELGGLRNREPGELIRLMRKKMGIPLSPLDLRQQTVDYIREKLHHLTSEISPTWPRLYPGVKELLLAIENEEFPIDIAIISSGHDEFIRRVFQVNEIQSPKILVTSDIIRERNMPKREKFKPHTYQLAEAHRQWIAGLDSSERGSYIGRSQGKQRMIYIGDDPHKDGGLAMKARIPYLFVPFTDPSFVPQGENAQLEIKDFFELQRMLKADISKLVGRESFASILFGRDDAELFPPVGLENRPYTRMLKNPEAEWNRPMNRR